MVLTWHEPGIVGNERIGAAFYMDADYEPVAVRLQAEKASSDGELEIDIYKDGVSIFTNTAADFAVAPTTKGPTVTSDTEKTSISLAVGQTHEELIANFKDENLEEGSWITCKVIDLRGGENISVQLELNKIE